MKAEERAKRLWDDAGLFSHPGTGEVAAAIRAAETEARKAALGEAAAHFEAMPTGPRGGQYHFSSGDIARRIRSLLSEAGGPQAPPQAAP